MSKTIVIALGGNALQKDGFPATAEAQLDIVKSTASYIADIIEEGNKVVITHGNGPQIGRILLASEYAAKITPPMPLDVCGAMSQGYIGYHIQQALGNTLLKRGIKKPVVTVITQVVVDKNDSAFENPTKPIGPFYSEAEARDLSKEKGYIVKEDAGRGWRRVVASPEPVRIVEIEAIKMLLKAGAIVIALGGGGIPVTEDKNGMLSGTAAVIDKDLGAEKLAEEINADTLLILTAVDKVAINYKQNNQRNLDMMTTLEAESYMAEGHFAPGSMLPKIKAAVRFANSNSNRKAIISSLHLAEKALAGLDGTTIIGALPSGNTYLSPSFPDSKRDIKQLNIAK
ncbi:MAG TPA: carbamate kinase [Syntrophomonadaceae bacterium]|nr:carbamate kinase [Syntrophomonadaceae bacterium]